MNELAEALKAIVRDVESVDIRRLDHKVAVLTSSVRTKWAEARTILMQGDWKQNA